MDRRSVTKVAKELGGKIIDRDTKTTLFEFVTEEDLYKFRERVGYNWDTTQYDSQTIRVWFEDYVRRPKL